MNKSIIELAKQSGFQTRGELIRTMHSSGAWVGVNNELQTFANLIRNQVSDNLMQPVSDEENEQFSNSVSKFAGADPEATKHALDVFLMNRIKGLK